MNTALTELFDNQWRTLLSENDFDEFTVTDSDDVETVLRALQETLLILDDTGIWDISTPDTSALMIAVDVAGLRLATDFEIKQFQMANDTPGEAVVRSVVAELLGVRTRLHGDLTSFVAACR
ncbi:hypothetical protein ACFV1N_25585 [Streptosporangium canum]|uniref:hypothetical protein n=1 Tax=Streptosporangium canum TaxID=324952 RepID=UPI00369C400A